MYPKSTTDATRRCLDRLVRRYDGPSHTGDMKCPICGAWGADQWINAGGVGIVQWVRVCPPCEQNYRQPNDRI